MTATRIHLEDLLPPTPQSSAATVDDEDRGGVDFHSGGEEGRPGGAGGGCAGAAEGDVPELRLLLRVWASVRGDRRRDGGGRASGNDGGRFRRRHRLRRRRPRPP